MKIPKKLKIGGHWFDIIYRDRDREDGTNSLGTENYAWNKIWLNKNQCQQQLESTFIHEILEVISSFHKMELDEKQIRLLETMLYQVLKDNKLLK